MAIRKSAKDSSELTELKSELKSTQEKLDDVIDSLRDCVDHLRAKDVELDERVKGLYNFMRKSVYEFSSNLDQVLKYGDPKSFLSKLDPAKIEPGSEKFKELYDFACDLSGVRSENTHSKSV